MDIKDLIRDVPNFPIEGIIFKDITTLLKDKNGFHHTLEQLYNLIKNNNITKVAAIESRGFILGGALAEKLGAGFIPIRKPGKLPAETISESYSLEYGKDSIEMHKDALTKDDRVLLHDDLLATGGTMAAACKLVEKCGASITQVSFIIELSFLNGREKLNKYDVRSLVQYGSE